MASRHDADAIIENADGRWDIMPRAETAQK